MYTCIVCIQSIHSLSGRSIYTTCISVCELQYKLLLAYSCMYQYLYIEAEKTKTKRRKKSIKKIIKMIQTNTRNQTVKFSLSDVAFSCYTMLTKEQKFDLCLKAHTRIHSNVFKEKKFCFPMQSWCSRVVCKIFEDTDALNEIR